MLIECFGKIGELKVVKGLCDFLNSVFYPILVMLLMVCANLFSLELPVYYCYIVLGTLCILFDKDLKGVIPIVAGCYMSVSAENNPSVYTATQETPSVFYDPQFKIQFIILLVFAGVLIAGRLVTLLIHGEKRKLPALALGFTALGWSYVMGGLFSEYYSLKTAVFGLVEIISLCGLYFLFYYGVNWKRVAPGEWAKLFTIIGFGVAIELIGMYVKSGIFTTPGAHRGSLVTGWGLYNNVGCVLAMCATAPFYFAATKKHGWVYALLSFLLYVALLFTQSRSAMLFGTLIFLVGIVILPIVTKGKERRNVVILIALMLAVIAGIIIVLFSVPALRERTIRLFSELFDKKFDNNGRFDIYKEGLEQFESFPFFGVGFYQCSTAWRWGNLSPDSFFPPRYHSTFIQLLASGGTFAIVCYLLHRVETILLFCRRRTVEKTFIALSIGALLLTSLLDCHFFNFGPGLLYGILLAYAEGSDLRNHD